MANSWDGNTRTDHSSFDESSYEFVNASIWISGSDGREIRSALMNLLADCGYLPLEVGEEKRGSWWQRFVFRSREMVRGQHFIEHAAELDRRLQIELVERRAAEVDSVRADSVSRLLTALDGQDQAVIVLGGLIVVKCNGAIVSRTIDAVTAGKIEKSSALLSDPEAVLRLLASQTDTQHQVVMFADMQEIDSLRTFPDEGNSAQYL